MSSQYLYNLWEIRENNNPRKTVFTGVFSNETGQRSFKISIGYWSGLAVSNKEHFWYCCFLCSKQFTWNHTGWTHLFVTLSDLHVLTWCHFDSGIWWRGGQDKLLRGLNLFNGLHYSNKNLHVRENVETWGFNCVVNYGHIIVHIDSWYSPR